MKSGVNIDCNYIISVKKLMEFVNLKKPTKKNVLYCDGEILPIIRVECEV